MTCNAALAGRMRLAVALAVGVAPPSADAQTSTKDTLSVIAGVHQATHDPHFATSAQRDANGASDRA